MSAVSAVSLIGAKVKDPPIMCT